MKDAKISKFTNTITRKDESSIKAIEKAQLKANNEFLPGGGFHGGEQT